MAVLSYQFSPKEIEQFDRLAQLGFEQQDQTSDPIDPEMVFSHSQLGIDFTFFPEGWQNEDDVEPKYWQIEVHGKTLSGSACITTDKLLTTTEFHTIVNPEHWSVMVPALQSLKSLAHWDEVMQPLLQGEQQEQSKSQAAHKLESMGVDQEALQARVLECFAAYGTEFNAGIDDVADFCEEPTGTVYLALLDLEQSGTVKLHRHKEFVVTEDEPVTLIKVSLTAAGKEQVNAAMDQSEREDEALIRQAIAHDIGSMRSSFPGKVTITHYEALIDRLQEGCIVAAQGQHPEMGTGVFAARYDAVEDVFNILLLDGGMPPIVKSRSRNADAEGVTDWMNAIEQSGGELFIATPDDPRVLLLQEAVEVRDAKIEQAKQAALVALKSGKEIVFKANLYQSEASVLSRLRYDAVTDTLIHSSANGQYPFHIALSQVDIDSSFSELGNNHDSILLRQPFDQYFEQVLDGVPYALESAPHRLTLLLETQDGSLPPLKIELTPVPEGYGGSFRDAFEQQKWKIDHAAPIRCGNARLEGGYLVSQRTTEGKDIFLGVTASPLQVLKVAQSLDLPLRDVLTEPLPLVRIEHLPALRRDRDCYNERREQVSQVVPRSGQPLDDQQIDVAIAVLIQRDAALNVKEKTNQLQVLGQSPIAQTLKERGGMDEMKAYLLTVMDQAREGLAKAPPGKAQEGR